MLVGVVGLSMWSYVVCSIELGGVCFENVRPLVDLGLLAMIFGGILFVVGIVLLAMAGPPSPQAAPRAWPPRDEKSERAPETPPESPPGGRYCPNCGTPNPLEGKYCVSCGVQLPAG